MATTPSKQPTVRSRLGCPYPISTFISTQGSITGVIFAILTFVLSAVIWFPFVKAYDDQKVKEETAAIKA